MNIKAKVIDIGTGESGYVRLLGGPPESIKIRSGAVTLQPGTCVGKHNTENREEILVILEGSGTFILAGSEQLQMKVNNVLDCPPHTEHDLKNTSTTTLCYIYDTA